MTAGRARPTAGEGVVAPVRRKAGEAVGPAPVEGSLEVRSGVVREGVEVVLVVLPPVGGRRWTRRGWLLVQRCSVRCCLLALTAAVAVVGSALELAAVAEQQWEAEVVRPEGVERTMEAEAPRTVVAEVQPKERLKMASASPEAAAVVSFLSGAAGPSWANLARCLFREQMVCPEWAEQALRVASVPIVEAPQSLIGMKRLDSLNW